MSEEEAEAQAALLRRLTFALWVGEHNQYVGALQGLVIDRLVAAFKYGAALEGWSAAVRWGVQVAALQCARVLVVRVAPENLTALWPIMIASCSAFCSSRARRRPPRRRPQSCRGRARRRRRRGPRRRRRRWTRRRRWLPWRRWRLPRWRGRSQGGACGGQGGAAPGRFGARRE